MKRSTHKKPHFFTVEEENFKSVALGYLDAGQILITHLPALMTLFNTFKNIAPQAELTEVPEDLNINLGEIVKNLPKDFIKTFTTELLCQTYVQDVDQSGNPLPTYTLIDPQNFSNLQECAKVCLEVFKHNFPDFFREGSVTEEKLELAEPKSPKQELEAPKKTRTLL